MPSSSPSASPESPQSRTRPPSARRSSARSEIEPTRRAQRWRVVHAELERIANHLDVAAKLAEDAALAVGAARFGILKEHVQRLRAQLCGSRFGRGVVAPGGLAIRALARPGRRARARSTASSATCGATGACCSPQPPSPTG